MMIDELGRKRGDKSFLTLQNTAKAILYDRIFIVTLKHYEGTIMKKKYVLVGASSRSLYMYAVPIKQQLADVAEVVGIMDVNPLRAEKIRKAAELPCKVYTDFDEMIKETRPDVSIVTTVDQFHHHYIVKSLNAGMDAITEKPMTIDAGKCLEILEAEKKTGKKVIVTFNYRFAPYCTRIKELIKEGVVGTVYNIDFEWILDTSHGADYFRRWHRKKENSGGLLVHKATHHFDLINWWLEDEPDTVMAFGARRFYGPTRKERGERCLTCQYADSCEFYFNLVPSAQQNKPSKAEELYYETESADGYFRDRCVFSDDIDIEDTMSVNVRYAKGAFLSYSLIAHSPYEGWRAAINGSEGRLEVIEHHSGFGTLDPVQSIDLFNRKGEKVHFSLPKATGGHGGGDERLRKMIFEGGIPDPLNHQAGSYSGAISVLIGIAANKSIEEDRAIRINDLVPLNKFKC